MDKHSVRAAGLIYGPQSHHLDHLATICILMQIPLLLTDEELARSAKKHYPHLIVKLYEELSAPEQIGHAFDLLFYSMPRILFDEIFFFSQKLASKVIHTIWCPHGNSDKGNNSLFMEALQKEKVALVYGKQMVDFLIRKEVLQKLKAYVITGNLRYSLYRKNRNFFTSLIEETVERKCEKGLRTLFFAPTWQDYENSSSFFEAAPLLLERLPDHYTLLIKLHPNLIVKNEEEIQKIREKYEGKKNVLFLTDFPPVYPLLDYVDIYIGDSSSIGYDFLTFNKPMFFLNQNKRNPAKDLGAYLYKCGTIIEKEAYGHIYEIIDQALPTDTPLFSQVRKEVYEETFGKEKEWKSLKEEILNTYSFFDEGLDFL